MNFVNIYIFPDGFIKSIPDYVMNSTKFSKKTGNPKKSSNSKIFYTWYNEQIKKE